MIISKIIRDSRETKQKYNKMLYWLWEKIVNKNYVHKIIDFITNKTSIRVKTFSVKIKSEENY